MLRVIRLLNELIHGLGELMLSVPVSFLRRPIRSITIVPLSMILWSLACLTPVLAQQWERLGPPGGMVISLAAASDGTAYLGTPDGHVFASRDRGERWELRGRAGGRLDAVVQRIVVDARNPNRLLAAVWFRGTPAGGIFESVDGAKKW